MLLHLLDRQLQSALQRHWVGAGGDHAQALANDRLSEHGRGRGTVTGNVIRLAGDLTSELSAQVLERILELDLFRYGDAVVDDARRAELLFQDHVAAAGTKRHAHGVGERVDTVLEAAAGLFVKE